MKIFELLNPDEATGAGPSDTSPLVSPTDTTGDGTVNATGASAPQPTQQTAGMMDTIKNFMTTPQPIGSAQAAPAAPQPAKPASANPLDGTIFGTVANSINKSTQPAPQPQQPQGMMDTIKNFMMTPQPIGGSNSTTPPRPTTSGTTQPSNPFKPKV